MFDSRGEEREMRKIGFYYESCSQKAYISNLTIIREITITRKLL